MEAFYKYFWPGNIRKLKSLIERLWLLSKDDQLALPDLPFEMMPSIEDEVKAIPNSASENLSAKESLYYKYKTSYKVVEAMGMS